ncbi:hypothetical protein PENSPDRAFT_310515 [Peniophora sp. CONT]|nr:hypothetical protein PENSPDRAFT_310515 [Peniophora sp. CONT]
MSTPFPGPYSRLRYRTRALLCPTTSPRALWQTDDATQFIIGMKAVIEAHRDLCEQGFVHRDICPGNISLYPTLERSVNPIAFIYDFDCVLPSCERNMNIVSTLQFQSRDVLDSIAGGARLTMTAHHGVESLVLVLAWAIFKRIVARLSTTESRVRGEAQRQRPIVSDSEDEGHFYERQYISPEAYLKEKLDEAFGQMFVDNILQARSAVIAFKWRHRDACMPAEIVDYFKTHDGSCMYYLLGYLGEMFIDDEARREKSDRNPDLPLNLDWQTPLQDRGYEEYFSHPSLLTVLESIIMYAQKLEKTQTR